jgi:adenylate kinase family enzyme
VAHGTIDDLRNARRVLCYGVTGAGKSTAALQLGHLLELPVHLVDEEIGWLPGWVSRPVTDQIDLATRMSAEESWVIDSAYGSWLAPVLTRAEVVVALDYPRWLSLARLVRRAVRRAATAERMCNGNVETWGRLLSADSIIRWHFQSYARKTARIRAWAADPDIVPVVRLTHPRELDALISALERRA